MNRDTLISQIMANPPYQLPPIVHGNGVYSLDIEYLGQPFCKIGFGLDEVLQAYFHFVTKVNYYHPKKGESMANAPVRPGYKLHKSQKKTI
jgi:hypothetical protein